MAKKVVEKILIEEESSDTVKVYKRVWKEIPDKPASKKAAPKSTKAKATKSKAKKGILDKLKKDEEPKASK